MSIRQTSAITALAMILGTLGCYIEATSTGSGTSTTNELGSRIEAEFALKTGGVGSTIRCSSGLSGRAGHRLMCSGETTDGYTLEIAVLERGGDAFRWDVVESKPIR